MLTEGLEEEYTSKTGGKFHICWPTLCRSIHLWSNMILVTSWNTEMAMSILAYQGKCLFQGQQVEKLDIIF